MNQLRAAGYKFLTEKHRIKSVSHWHCSYVGEKSYTRLHHSETTTCEEIFSARNWPGDSDCDHLEFAIKYDGINLALLALLFPKISAEELAAFIKLKPLGIYRRKMWFLYEFLTATLLELADLTTGNYVEILDSEEDFTLANAPKSQRHRITNNFIGTANFCPVVRKTKSLKEIDSRDFTQQCAQILNTYDPELLHRALSYLYTKETKSSFEIEHINPSPSRTEKFIALLTLAETKDFCQKDRLIELQNLIVDERFADTEFRTEQNYVGQTITFQKEIIHFICPKPENVESLMEGLIESHRKMSSSTIPAIVHAAVIAYGFVFIHPFEDGNGRIHRFLIHNILARRGFTPKGIMIPVSAAMLKNPTKYDQSLEQFSQPLLENIDYVLTRLGEMSVKNDTAHWYRYIDMTAQAEALLGYISETISKELIEELDFLAVYDNAKTGIQECIDLPDRLIDLFINLCLQNNGKLSDKKHENHFSMLTQNEISKMERVVSEAFTKVQKPKT